MTDSVEVERPAGSGPPDRALGRRLAIAAMLGVAVYAVFLLLADLEGIREALGRLDPWLVPAACGLSFLNYCVRFPRWQRYLGLAGSTVRGRTSFLIYLAGLSLTVSPGKLGEALKSWLVKEVDGTALARTAPIVVAERFTDLLGFLVLIAVGGLATEYDFVFWGTLGLCAVLLVLVGSRTVGHVVLSVVARVPVVGPLAPRVEESLDSARRLLAPRELPVATVLAATGWSLECLGAWLVADAMLPGGASLLYVTWAFALAAVAGAVIVLLPGGLGVTEGLFAGLLERRAVAHGAVEGAARSAAISATLVTRLCTLWFAMGLGLVALGIFRRERRRTRA